MKHRKNLHKMSRTSSHRKALLANLALAFCEKGRIQTTFLKAKRAQRVVEKLITLAKKNTLHARRLVFAELRNDQGVRRLFGDIAPACQNRNGGYTRVVKLGMRKGDGALVAQLELVDALAAPAAEPSKAGVAQEKQEVKKEALKETKKETKKKQ